MNHYSSLKLFLLQHLDGFVTLFLVSGAFDTFVELYKCYETLSVHSLVVVWLAFVLSLIKAGKEHLSHHLMKLLRSSLLLRGSRVGRDTKTNTCLVFSFREAFFFYN